MFKANCVTPNDPGGLMRLQVYLDKCMVRRTHLDTLFNARLLDLPTPSEHTIWLEFNDVERQIYEIVKKRFIEHINSLSKYGGLENQYSHIWTMILRLRQICSHSLLVQGTICDLLEREDYEKLNAITAKEDEMHEEGACLLMHLRNVLKNNVSVKSIHGGLQGAVMSEGASIPMDIVNAEDPEGKDMTGGKHGVSFRFRKYLDNLRKSNQWAAIADRTICTACKQPPKYV